MNFSDLIVALSKINNDLRDQSIRAVNTALTMRNWVFGFCIVEFEQNGNDRAAYGEALLSSISKKLKELRIPNSDERELRRYRQFYLIYSEANKFVISDIRIRGLPNPEFALLENDINNSEIGIRGLPNPEFTLLETHYINLFNKISYTHFKELLRIEDPLKRLFMK